MPSLVDAWLVGWSLWVLAELSGRIDRLNWSNDEATKAWVDALSNSWLRWPFKASMALLAGELIVFWAIPFYTNLLQQGLLGVLMTIVGAVAGIGLGLSVAKHITEHGYVVWENPHRDQ